MAITSCFDLVKVKLAHRKLKRAIKIIHPEWLDFDGCYCLPSPTYFAVGFLLDHKSSGSEIYLLAVPLFSTKAHFHLSYAEIIIGGEGCVAISGKSAISVAQEFSAKVASYVEVARARDDLNWFVRYLEEENLIRNTRLKYDYGLALILLNRFEEARVFLGEVADDDWERRVAPEEAMNAAELAKMLESDPREAFK